MSLLPEYRDIVDTAKKSLSREVREENAKLRDMILQLEDELERERREKRELRERLVRQDTIRFREGRYWTENGAEHDGPFCPHCYDQDQKLMHLHAREPGAWRCSRCDGFFPDDSYRDPPSCTVVRSDFDVFEV